MLQSDCPCLEVGHSCQIPCAKISAHLTKPTWPSPRFPFQPCVLPSLVPFLIWSTCHSSDIPSSCQVIHLCYLAWAARIKYQSLGGLNNRNWFLTVLEAGSTGWRFDLFWGPSRWLTDTTLPIYFHGHLCVCPCPTFHKDNNHTELETTHMTWFYLSCFFKDCIYKYSHIPRCWKLGPQHWNMEKTQFAP